MGSVTQRETGRRERGTVLFSYKFEILGWFYNFHVQLIVAVQFVHKKQNKTSLGQEV